MSQQKKKKKSQLMEKKQEMVAAGEGVDQFSTLHTPVVHHIMSFLPTADAVTMSALSKRFNALWHSFPIIDFDQALFDKKSGMSKANLPKLNKFLDFVTDSIQRRQLETDVAKFSLKCYIHNIKSDPRIDNAINFALVNNVSELDLSFIWKCTKTAQSMYLLKDTVSLKTVTSLKLRGFKLNLSWLLLTSPLMEGLTLRECHVSEDNISPSEDGDMVSFRSLRFLSFEDVNVSQKWVEDHLPRFVNVERLKLSGCSEMKNIVVVSEKMREIELNANFALESVQIVAPSLSSFILVGNIRIRCTVDITSCKFLKHLYLTNVYIDEAWLKPQLYSSSRLESLRLVRCPSLRRLEIFCKRLRDLDLRWCKFLVEVRVDTPNLVSFTYAGRFILFASMNSPRLRNPILTFEKHDETNFQWFSRLRDMLTRFDHCESLTLNCDNSQDLMFPEDLRASILPPLYDIKMLHIHMSGRLVIGPELVHNLLWISPHVETLCFNSNNQKKVIKLQYDWEATEDISTECCQRLPIKCWRHFLNKVEMENLDRDFDDADGLQEYFKKERRFAGNNYPLHIAEYFCPTASQEEHYFLQLAPGDSYPFGNYFRIVAE